MPPITARDTNKMAKNIAIRNEDFEGPSSVIIYADQSHASFQIRTHIPFANKTIHISGTSEYIELSCNNPQITLLKNEYYFLRNSCCPYFTLQYEEWQSCTRIPEPEYPLKMLEDGSFYGDGEY